MNGRVCMIAVVGKDGGIGGKDDLPQFLRHTDAVGFLNRVRLMTQNGVVLVGSNTMRIMQSRGLEMDGVFFSYAIWSREWGLTPKQVIAELQALSSRPIFICGGAKTFELFGPLCDSYYIHKADLVDGSHHKLKAVIPGLVEPPAHYAYVQ